MALSTAGVGEAPAPAGDANSSAGVRLFASARLFLLLQLASRLCTFALNQFLVRITAPEVFGAATIQLELLIGVILTAAREGVRCVILREGKPQAHGAKSKTPTQLAAVEQLAHNLSFVSVAVGIAFDVVFSTLYVRHASDSLRSSAHFAPAVALFALGGALELLSEPLFNRAQVLGNVQLRVRAEGIAIIANCVTILACMVRPELFGVDRRLGATYGLMAYGYGRLALGAATLLCYLYAFSNKIGLRRTRALLWPRRAMLDGRERFLSPNGISIAWAMGKQAMLKHVMGESDKIAVARLGTLEDQGSYALASNYGSLVLRILFNPVEEATRIAFSSSLGHILSDRDGQIATITAEDERRMETASATVAGVLRLHALLGLFFVTFGPPLAKAAVFLLAGRRWACATSAPIVLGAYACYIPVLGLNGIAEGFLTATAGPKQLGTYNWVLVVSSGAFAAALWTLQQVPALQQTVLVWSSIVAIGVRAAYSWWHMSWFFSLGKGPAAAQVRPTAILPTAPTLVAFAVAAGTLRTLLSSDAACPAGVRELGRPIGVGAFFAAACLVSCVLFERRNLRAAFATVRSRGKQKQS